MTHEHDTGTDYDVSLELLDEHSAGARDHEGAGCMRFVLLIVVVIVGVFLLEAGNPVLLCVALTLGALIWGLLRDMD